MCKLTTADLDRSQAYIQYKLTEYIISKTRVPLR